MKKMVFTFEKETKNTYRYQEDSQDPIIGVLYVQKKHFPNKPTSLIVTIEEGTEK